MEQKIISVELLDNAKGCRIVAGHQTREGYVRRTYSIAIGIYKQIGSPTVGDILMDEEIKIINMGTDRAEAMARALRILSYSDNNRASLTKKLLEHGHYKENVIFVTQRMVELNYINERRQLDALTVSYANKKLWGRRNIASHLIAKGYEAKDIHSAIDDAIERGDIDFDLIKRRLLRETVGANADERDIRAILYKYGH